MNRHNSAALAALLLRTSLGAMFISHALLKILVFTPAGTAGFFASLGVPGWLAYPVMAAELIGGLMLIVGFKTRIVSLVLVPVLLGSIVLVHAANGWLFSNPNGGWEYPAFLIMASFSQALLGDGAYSIAALFNRQLQSARTVTA